MRSIRVVDSMAEVGKQEWDRLAGDNVVVTHGWLTTLERTYRVGLEPQYVLMREGERLVGAAVSYVSQPTEDVQTLDDVLYGRLKTPASRLGGSFLPALSCSPIRGLGSPLLLDGDLADQARGDVMAELLDALERMTEPQRLALCFLNVPEDEVDLRRMLRDRGYNAALALPTFYIDVKWPSFDAYVADIKRVSKNMARNVTKEINRNRKAGVRIERLDDVTAHRDRLYELADEHWFRYNQRRFPYTRDFFETAREQLGEGAVVYAAFKESMLIGFMLLLRKDKRAYALELGIDPKLGDKNATYFNLDYYAPLSDAMDNGTRRIHLGGGLRDAKLRRGGKKMEMYLYYRSASRIRNLALRPFFGLYSLWVRRKWRSRPVDPTSRIWVDRSDREP